LTAEIVDGAVQNTYSQFSHLKLQDQQPKL